METGAIRSIRSRRAGRDRGPARLVALSLAFFLAAGCAATKPRESVKRFAPPDSALIAVLPFEDLSGREGVGSEFTRTFTAELVRTGAFTVIEQGVVDDAVERLQIRTTRAMTDAETRALADSLNVAYLLFGNVLESGVVRTPDGDLPTVSATLRIVDTATGRVVWACHHTRTGDDRETVFGWGRNSSRLRLLDQLAIEMLSEFRQLSEERLEAAQKKGSKS